MSVTLQALGTIDQHWAVKSVSEADRQRAFEVAKMRFVNAAVGNQLRLDFTECADDSGIIDRVMTAYEIAALEGVPSLLNPPISDAQDVDLREQAQAGAHRCYDLLRTVAIPTEEESRAYHVLHLSALAHCSDRWSDQRRWLQEHEDYLSSPTPSHQWDKRVLFALSDCWVRLFRKRSWEDLSAIAEQVSRLRDEQNAYEEQALSQSDPRHMAYRLVSLYHWARATELLATYALQGEPVGIQTELDQHFEAAGRASLASQDVMLDMLLRWLHVAARRMVVNSIWWVAHAVNSRVTRFAKSITRSRGMFELLPPQRAAIQDQGLLDQASRAIAVEMPTSGGKTALAEFRILQALNQFDADRGWVAYVAPTRALVAQLTRRLREDFAPLEIQVEQLSGAVEVDVFEDAMLSSDADSAFHVLVTTPEKLNLVIRNKLVSRPLVLAVMDEAHNLEDAERGLRIELLLATIKRDCLMANFLLLMPYVPNAGDLVRWLAPESGRTISFGSSAWQPNERIVGMYSLEKHPEVKGDWSLSFETLTTTPRTIHLSGTHAVGPHRPLDVSYSTAKKNTVQTGAMATVFSSRGTSIAVARTIDQAWDMARTVKRSLAPFCNVPPDVQLVQRYLATEVSPDFELIDLLAHGIAVHHAGLSDETRSLVEWLTETGVLRVLCATTTLAQGINFPVSSVFLASRYFADSKGSKEMSARAFWNLAGRAGRIGHDSVGVVGIAAGESREGVIAFVSKATEDLVSRLVNMLDEIETQGRLNDLSLVIQQDQWADFRSYVAHLWNEKRNLDAVLSETEQLLRNTYGYGQLQSRTDESSARKRAALLEATKLYAHQLAEEPERATLADATGFAPEAVAKAMGGLQRLECKLSASDWMPSSLFGDQANSRLPALMGVMMRIPELQAPLKKLTGEGKDHHYVADLANAWVAGQSISEIAERFFGSQDLTESITNACKGLYRYLANSAPWGISALSKMPLSGLDFESLSEEERRTLNRLPAMLYHGVKSEAAILMRMNSTPRSISEALGSEFERQGNPVSDNRGVSLARNFLKSLTESDWDRLAPVASTMSGADYRDIWSRLSGVAD